MGGNPENNEIEVNKQFYEATVDPQLIVAKMQLMDRGVITISDVRDSLRKSGLIDADRSDEDIDEELEMEDPLEGMMPTPSQPPMEDNEEDDEEEPTV
jgi:hypothetical protein